MANHPNRGKGRLYVEGRVCFNDCSDATLAFYAKCFFTLGEQHGRTDPWASTLTQHSLSKGDVMRLFFKGGWLASAARDAPGEEAMRATYERSFGQVFTAGYHAGVLRAMSGIVAANT